MQYIKFDRFRLVYAVLFLFIVLRVEAFAEEKYDYPELMVTPSASKRLMLEANKEKDRRLFYNSPIQISGLTTLTTGLLMLGQTDKQSDPDMYGAYAGISVGAGWLLISYYAGRRTFQRGYDSIKNMPVSSKRQQLEKERLAEEELEDIRSMGTRLLILSTITNLASSIYMTSQSKEDSLASFTGIVSAITALAPIIFPSPWRKPAAEHQRYKKRIYGPIASGTLLYEPKVGKAAPGLLLSYSF